MKDIQFSIPWIVQPKQSTRFTKEGRRYTPKAVKENAAALAAMFAPFVPDEPLVGPVRLHVAFWYPWRKSEPKWRRAKGWAWKDTKPDDDNLRKQVSDVMEKCGFFTNDSQIAWGETTKQWGDKGCVNIILKELPR